MARPCEICTSPNAANIDRLLAAGETCSSVSNLLGLSVQSLRRHKQNHLIPKVQKAARVQAAQAKQAAGINTDLSYEGAPNLLPMPYDPDLIQTFDIVQIVHQQFTDLEAAKRQLKSSEDARGVAVVADLILKHADKIAPTHGHDIALEPADLIRPLTDKLLVLAEKYPQIKDDLTDLLLEIEHAG